MTTNPMARQGSTMQMIQERTRQIGVRIDDDLYEALERDAKENGRTVTQSVRFLLGKAVQAA